MCDLKNSVVFITGGTSGYGKAMAKAFCAKGARVIIAARHEDRLAAAKAGVRNFSKSLYTELQPYGVRVSCIIPAAAATGFHKAAHMDSINAALQPEDIADTAVSIASLPDRAVVEEVTVWGVDQVVSPL